MLRLVAIIAFLVAASGVAMAADYNEFRVGTWEGRAHRSKRSGEFTHCAISTNLPDSTFFTFGISRDNVFTIFFGDDTWHLPDDGRYPVELAVDGRSIGKFSAYATGDITLRVGFGTGRVAFDALRRGKRLTIKTPLRNFSFALKKTAQALRRLQDCVDKETATAAVIGSDPFARDDRPGRNPFTQGPGPGPRTYTREEVVDILSKAGIREPDFLSPGEVRQYPGFRHMWQVGDVVGFVAQYLRNPNTSVDEQMAVFLANFADSCTGKATSGTEPAKMRGAFVFKEGFVSCAGEADFYVRAVAVFETSRLSIFGYIGWGADSRAPAETAAAKLGDALRQMYF